MEVRTMLKKFSKKRVQQIPAVLTQPENPVNYKSVLEYLVGLSKAEYERIIKVSVIYRKADKEAAKVLGVKDEPTVQLKGNEPTSDQLHEGVDEILNADDDIAFILGEEEEITPPETTKAHAPKKKVDA